MLMLPSNYTREVVRRFVRRPGGGDKGASCVPTLAVCLLAWAANVLANGALVWDVWFAMALVLLLVTLYVVVVCRHREYRMLCQLVLLGGLLLRVAYVLEVPFSFSRHDLGYITGLSAPGFGDGHLGYVEYLLKNRTLPNFDPREVWSFFNPPGFHIVAALFVALSRAMGVAEPLCFESIQICTLLSSSLTVWLLVRLLDEFDLGDGTKLLLAAFLSFHPFMLVMAATCNNDSLVFLLCSSTLFWTIRWVRTPSMGRIVAIALSLGLALFTKFGAGIMAPAVAVAFIMVFVREQKARRGLAAQFAVLLALSVPVALFYPLRNAVRFDMPLLYVQSSQSQSFVQADLLRRIGLPLPKDLAFPFITFDPSRDVNVWACLLKTSLFDETFTHLDVGFVLGAEVVLLAVFLTSVVMLALSLAVVRTRMPRDPVITTLMVTLYLTSLAAYVYYCLREPFVFTMNYRYIPLALYPPLVGVGFWLEGHDASRSPVALAVQRAGKALVTTSVVFSVITLIGLFLVASQSFL